MADKMQGMNALAKRIEMSELKPGDAERAAIREMVKSAKHRGLALTGPDGLLKVAVQVLVDLYGQAVAAGARVVGIQGPSPL